MIRSTRLSPTHRPWRASPTTQTRHQDVVVHLVEELLKVDIHDDVASLGHVFLGLGQRVVRAAPWPKTVARCRKGGVEDRLQHLPNRLLHQTVHHRGNAQLSHSLPAGLGDLHPTHRLRLVAAVQ
jgi:hypothetical protein